MPAPFIIGWEEWVALPDLGLPAIKAKVDTGARTSALHAHQIVMFGPVSAPLVRFCVYPVANRNDIEITCSAPIVDRRDVTSSNGDRESRFVILTGVRIGTRSWPVEITLTNRETMSYRMLLGRQAIKEDMFVDPAASFRQPKLSYKPYKQLPRRDPVHRALRLAVLTRKPDAPGSVRLARAATERSHVAETLDVARLALRFDGLIPGLMRGKVQLGHFDAIIPRIGAGSAPFARAVVRQFEMMGSVSLNPSDALDCLANPLTTRQALLAAGVPTIGPGSVNHDNAKAAMTPPLARSTLSVLVCGRNAIAAIALPDEGRARDAGNAIDPAARRAAVLAARSLKLRLAAIDLVAQREGYAVASVSPLPSLGRFERLTGRALAHHIVADVESQVRSWMRRADLENSDASDRGQ